jgi:hypothetical protein
VRFDELALAEELRHATPAGRRGRPRRLFSFGHAPELRAALGELTGEPVSVDAAHGLRRNGEVVLLRMRA